MSVVICYAVLEIWNRIVSVAMKGIVQEQEKTVEGVYKMDDEEARRDVPAGFAVTYWVS